MAADFVLAHLSDPHLGPLPVFGPSHWNAKRLLGFLNWHRRRRFVYRVDVARRLVADMMAQAPDHIAVTGDLVNIGLPREHAAARAWLETLGAPDHVSVVPGNHDIYTPLGNAPGVALWQSYMASDEAIATDNSGLGFPFVRNFGNISLIGVNSAVPTPLGHATGLVDDGQLSRFAGLLKSLGAAGKMRLVLIHHPPLVGQATPRRALINAAQFERVLTENGAELVLHGHNHVNSLEWRQGPAHDFAVIGIASASHYNAKQVERRARYNLYRIAFSDGQPRIAMTGRGFATADGPVEQLEQRDLIRQPAHAL